jgi:drug/metabolite transporter (DMT)-like permease
MIGRALRGRTGRGRWIGSIGFAVCGVVVVVAEAIGGSSTGQMIFAAALFGGIAVLLAFGGRSESVRAFRGDLNDERLDGIQLRAQALAGQIVIVAVVVAFLVELALGHSGAPFDWLAAIGGFTYLAAYTYGTRR